MVDLFSEKAQDWDRGPLPQIISEGVAAALRSAVDFRPTMRVMDFGAGTGLIASRVAPYVAHVAAVDISKAMLEKLAEKPELRGKVTIHCQDILDTPLASSFDGIVSAMALHHVEDIAALFRAFHWHLGPDGFVALADLDTEDGSFHPPGTEGVYHHGFDRHELAERLREAGFDEVAFETAARVTNDDRAYTIFLAVAKRRGGSSE